MILDDASPEFYERTASSSFLPLLFSCTAKAGGLRIWVGELLIRSSSEDRKLEGAGLQLKTQTLVILGLAFHIG